jgi:hypothetical protein
MIGQRVVCIHATVVSCSFLKLSHWSESVFCTGAGSVAAPLWSHCKECHGGDQTIPIFSMTLISRHGDALARLLVEGIEIRDENPLSLMSSRSEKTKSRVARAKGRLTM